MWRKWLLPNKTVNWVDTNATLGGTDAGIDTERHGGRGLIGFADGHVERVGKERARKIDDGLPDIE